MCNLAGYAGNRQAAPILLEMLRKQQAYNGGKSTGIATIHEGKIHMRKVVGNVDDLIRNTDALELPGTIGIAHSRPSGKPGLEEYAQPFLSMDDDSVLMTNGIQPAFSPTLAIGTKRWICWWIMAMFSARKPRIPKENLPSGQTAGLSIRRKSVSI